MRAFRIPHVNVCNPLGGYYTIPITTAVHFAAACIRYDLTYAANPTAEDTAVALADRVLVRPFVRVWDPAGPEMQFAAAPAVVLVHDLERLRASLVAVGALRA